MIKNIFWSLSLYIVSIIIIAAYCVFLNITGDIFFSKQTKGSLIIDANKQIRGSYLLAQNININRYFSSRIIEENDNKCKTALYNEKFKTKMKQRYSSSYNRYDVSAVAASASLLDPYITERDALLQASIIAAARDMKFADVLQIVKSQAIRPSRPFFETSIVNTTILNAILDGYDQI